MALSPAPTTDGSRWQDPFPVGSPLLLGRKKSFDKLAAPLNTRGMGNYGIGYFWKALLTLALSSLAASPGIARVVATPATESEASPLFARSLQGAFADMAARDRGIARGWDGSPWPATGSGAVVVVDGTRWFNGAAARRAGSLGASPIQPLGTTTDVTCQPTYSGGTTCGSAPTCSTSPTCGGIVTCQATCGATPTCLISQPTCFVNYTCKAPTCAPTVTCTGPTCLGTCAPASCPTALTAVSVPQPGQIRLSFSSSAQLSYVLQYCTNLSASGWVEACSTNGNGGVITLVHTNGAMMSVYRLLIQ